MATDGTTPVDTPRPIGPFVEAVTMYPTVQVGNALLHQADVDASGAPLSKTVVELASDDPNVDSRFTVNFRNADGDLVARAGVSVDAPPRGTQAIVESGGPVSGARAALDLLGVFILSSGRPDSKMTIVVKRDDTGQKVLGTIFGAKRVQANPAGDRITATVTRDEALEILRRSYIGDEGARTQEGTPVHEALVGAGSKRGADGGGDGDRAWAKSWGRRAAAWLLGVHISSSGSPEDGTRVPPPPTEASRRTSAPDADERRPGFFGRLPTPARFVLVGVAAAAALGLGGYLTRNEGGFNDIPVEDAVGDPTDALDLGGAGVDGDRFDNSKMVSELEALEAAAAAGQTATSVGGAGSANSDDGDTDATFVATQGSTIDAAPDEITNIDEWTPPPPVEGAPAWLPQDNTDLKVRADSLDNAITGTGMNTGEEYVLAMRIEFGFGGVASRVAHWVPERLVRTGQVQVGAFESSTLGLNVTSPETAGSVDALIQVFPDGVIPAGSSEYSELVFLPTVEVNGPELEVRLALPQEPIEL